MRTFWRVFFAFFVCIFLMVDVSTVSAGSWVWVRSDNGMEGGLVLDIAFDPSDPLIMYIVTQGSGVFKTTDGGSNWQLLQDGLIHLNPVSIAVDPDQSETLYIGSGPATLYVSHDQGENWETSFSFGGYAISNIDLGSGEDAYDYAYSYDTLYVRGPSLSWTRSKEGLPGWPQDAISCITRDPADPQIVYACTPLGLYKADDYGLSWVEFGNGLPNNDGVYDFLFDPIDPDIAYATTYNAIYRSLDRGETWTLFSTQFARELLIVAEPTRVFYVTAYGDVLKSYDGQSWTTTNNGSGPVSVRTLKRHPITASLYAGTRGAGLYVTSDQAESWQMINSGITATLVTSIAVDPLNPQIVYSTTQMAGLFKSEDGGLNWTSSGELLRNTYLKEIKIVRSSPNVLFAIDSSNLYKSIDRGVTWNEIASDVFVNVGIANLTLNPVRALELCISTNLGLFKSTDGGNTWELITIEASALDFISYVVYDPIDPDTLYATATDGLYKTTDGGVTWSNLIGTNEGEIIVTPQEPRHIYVREYFDIWRSIDGGTTWVKFLKPYQDYHSNCFASSPTNSMVMIVFPDYIIVDFSGGGHWINVTDGIDPHIVRTLTIDPSNTNRVFAGTMGQGVYTIDMQMPNRVLLPLVYR